MTEKENYYLLLELSVEPAEKDTKVIEEALKKKQSQWSRYRNHPTKAIKAKQYIDMIPQIRKVMTDPELRQKEAVEAKKILGNKETNKYSKLDRHLELLMSKGGMTKKEIAKLAKMHGIEENVIRERVKKKEKIFKIDKQISLLMEKGEVPDKKIAGLAKHYAIGEDKIREWIAKKKEAVFTDIDSYIASRSANEGFVTETAVARLAKLYSCTQGDIMMRLKNCAVRKEDRKTEKPETLDRSIERLISENLKIAGKSSLYDFLDLSADSSLAALQKTSREKEIEIRKIGQKDAVATASGALAGHCIVIFSSKASRNAYDMTRSRTRLTELNSDIDVAGIEGKIRPEYFDILIRTAMKNDMDIEDAVEYVKAYCEKEKWIIKEKKKWMTIEGRKLTLLEKWVIELDPKKKSFWILAGAAAGVMLIVIGSIVFTGRMIQANRLKNAYQAVLTSLESRQSLAEQERVLQEFLSSYGETEYAPAVNNKIREIRRLMEEQDFAETVKDAEKLYADKKFEEAKIIFEQYLGKYPKGIHVNEIKEKAAQIPVLIENRDYEALAGVANLDFAEKIKAYNDYFTKYPEGSHIEDVKKLIVLMISEVFRTLQQNLNQCEKQLEWEKCMQLCDDFIARFGGTEEAGTAEGLKIKYYKRIQHNADLTAMRKEAELRVQNEDEPDYIGAKQIYEMYLEANPEAPAYLKQMIEGEIAGWEKRHKAYLQEEEQWQSLSEYCAEPKNSLGDKVLKAETYLKQNPPKRHSGEASELLADLQNKKKLEDADEQTARIESDWRDLIVSSKNARIPVSERVNKAEAYIRENQGGKYIRDAAALLEQLKAEKKAEDERIKAEQALAAKRQKELKRMSELVRQTGGRFSDTGNGVIRDSKTGLMWSSLDSSADIGQCVDYQTAMQYVESLTTGGYEDWRLPTVSELVGIYKNRPFFPPGESAWYWSSDILWHGWNKQVYIVTSKQELAWNKDQADLFKCGSVRAVRSGK